MELYVHYPICIPVVNKNSFTLPVRKQVKNLKYLACEISYENEKGLVNNINDQLDATINFFWFLNQLNMFRAIICPSSGA